MAFIRFASNNKSRREDLVSRLQRKLSFLLLSVMASKTLPLEQRRNLVVEQIICGARVREQQDRCQQSEDLRSYYVVSHGTPLLIENSCGDDSRVQKYIISPMQENDRVVSPCDP
jgi:hypothetical protein